MNAESLFQDGLTAIRSGKRKEGRSLIQQALKKNIYNHKAWITLARIENNSKRKRYYLEQALKIAPNNFQAKTMLSRLPPPPKPPQIPIAEKEKQIKEFLKTAKKLRKKDKEAAIEQWVNVLQLQVDHPEAIQQAVETLDELGYQKDAAELLNRAIDAETQQPFIYQLAIKHTEKYYEPEYYEWLQKTLVNLPDVTDDIIIKVVDQLIVESDPHGAFDILQDSLKKRPKSQKLLVRMGDFVKSEGRVSKALRYYNQAAQLGYSKEAEKRLKDYPPILTDRERSSILLAWREAIGIGLFFLTLAWQDAGLNLLRLDIFHWLGVILSFLGAYLLITATSSPQQRIIAIKLRGKIPEQTSKSILVKRGRGNALQEATSIPKIPVMTRNLLAFFGITILSVAFILVFSTAIELLFSPIPPDIPIFGDFS